MLFGRAFHHQSPAFGRAKPVKYSFTINIPESRPHLPIPESLFHVCAAWLSQAEYTNNRKLLAPLVVKKTPGGKNWTADVGLLSHLNTPGFDLRRASYKFNLIL
jgi:hypothetical protein